MGDEMHLPPIAPFPEAAWRQRQIPDEWEVALDSWIILTEAHLSFSDPVFLRVSVKDETLSSFLKSFVAELALSHDTLPSKDTKKTSKLRKLCFLLLGRILFINSSDKPTLLRWETLADISLAYGNENGRKLICRIWNIHSQFLESLLSEVKKGLTKELDAGLNGNWREVIITLQQVSHLIRSVPEGAELFLAGSDFLDALLSGYAGVFDPQFRETLVETTYYCLVGLTAGDPPKFGPLLDQLYALKTATEAHKVSSTNSQYPLKDSLVAHLVAETNLLTTIRERFEANHAISPRATAVLDSLAHLQKPGGRPIPTARKNSKPQKRVEKGKLIAAHDDRGYDQVHIHAASLITQVQDIFPDLGSGFITKLLDEYNNDTEQVIAHLLEDSLPDHLVGADRSEILKFASHDTDHHALNHVPHSPVSELPIRRNVFDDDEFDKLSVSPSKLRFGRKNPEQTADDVLQDKSNAPNKAAILSALAAFDSDDDERDDSYDTADVGGTVTNEDAPTDSQDIHEEALFLAYKSTPTLFGRDKATREGRPRAKLREEVGMTDEAIEGWAIMLNRDSRKLRRLEAQFSQFSGQQNLLAPTSWKASPNASGTEDSDVDGRNANDRGRGGRLRGQVRGRGRARGNVAGPTGDRDTDAARRGKEANKGSRANHNRKDQRGKKMARGGFPG